MRVTRKARRRMEREKLKQKKRLNTYPAMSFSVLLALSPTSVANAGTIDDLRELVGEQRVDEQFTALEQHRIRLEYAKIENHNRVAKMMAQTKGIDVTSEADKQREILTNEIEKQRNELVSSFTSGSSVATILGEKTTLNTLEYSKSRIKQTGVELYLEEVPNTFAKKYKQLLEIEKEVEEYKDIGDIGVDLQSPVRNHFYISSPFGMRFQTTKKVTSMHNGLDLAAETGTDVISAWRGVVTAIYTSKDGGNTIEITHDDGLKTRYLHLDEFKTKLGKRVKQYELIGSVGSTGDSTGPHLHFEVLIDGKHVNPIFFFGKNGVKALKEYLSQTEDALYVDMNPLMEKIKDRPNWLQEVEKGKKEERVIEGEKRDGYNKTGKVPKGSVTIKIQEGFEMPKPSDDIK